METRSRRNSNAGILGPVPAKVTKTPKASRRNSIVKDTLGSIKETAEKPENMDVDPASEDDRLEKQDESLFVPGSPSQEDVKPPAKTTRDARSKESSNSTKTAKAGPKSKTTPTGDKDSTISSPNKDPDNLITIVDVLGKMGLGDEYQLEDGSKPLGWIPGYWGQTWVVLQQGPKNSARFRIVPQTLIQSDITKDKDCDLRKHRPGEEFKITAIQGVAWDFSGNDQSSTRDKSPADDKSSDGNTCPERLLNPEFWPAGPKGRKRSPYTLVLAKFEDEEGETRKSWVTRTDIRRKWGNKKWPLTDDIMLRDSVLIPKDQGIGMADVAIVMAATACEERYQRWCQGERKSEDRSPTPVERDETLHDAPE